MTAAPGPDSDSAWGSASVSDKGFKPMLAKRRQLLWTLLIGAGAPRTVTAAACTPTETNSLGPFYREQAPFQAVLAAPSEPGEPLTITGRVLAADGCTPLRNAVVDAWHANARGQYYNVASDRDEEPAQYRLRGRVRTDARGEYRFDTIMPGSYSMGSTMRPRHVHFIASHRRARQLVTQMYFAGDPNLESDWLAKDSLVMEKSGDSVQFDIVLRTAS